MKMTPDDFDLKQTLVYWFPVKERRKGFLDLQAQRGKQMEGRIGKYRILRGKWNL